MNTLLLDRDLWDLCKDSQGNIALANNPYAIAQDTASALRLFLGELWYDTAKGVPYLEQILGQMPALNAVKSLFSQAALAVPEVVAAQVFIESVTDRTLIGQVQVTTDAGTFLVVTGVLPANIIPA